MNKEHELVSELIEAIGEADKLGSKTYHTCATWIDHTGTCSVCYMISIIEDLTVRITAN